jgi:hypothetical protein
MAPEELRLYILVGKTLLNFRAAESWLETRRSTPRQRSQLSQLPLALFSLCISETDL